MRRRREGAASDSAACATVLAIGRRQLPRRGQPGASCTSASRRTRSASSRWGRLVKEPASRLDPLEAFRGQLHAGRRDAARCGGGCASSRTCAAASATSSRSTSAAAAATSTSRFAARSSTALAEYAEQLRLKAPEIGIVDADTTLKLNKPELRVQIDREPRRRPRRRHRGHRRGAAADGRRRRGGHALPRPERSTRTTTCSCAWPKRDRSDPATLGAAARAARATASWCGSTTW